MCDLNEKHYNYIWHDCDSALNDKRGNDSNEIPVCREYCKQNY